MNTTTLILLIVLLGIFGFYMGRKKALVIASVSGSDADADKLKALPKYYGYMNTVWVLLPALVVLTLWALFSSTVIDRMVVSGVPESTLETVDNVDLYINQIKIKADAMTMMVDGDTLAADEDPVLMEAASQYNRYHAISNTLRSTLMIALSLVAGLIAFSRIKRSTNTRIQYERVIEITLMICASIAILTTAGIVLSVLFEALNFFGKVPVTEFMFGTSWSPQMALRADQVGSSGSFGAVPLFIGTMLISAVALCVAIPIGLRSAVYLSEYASRRFRAIVKPILEILAGIPTVVYGFFAALTVAPLIRSLGEMVGLSVASESALAAGLVMGVMIIPFVSSLTDDVISAVPDSMREGSLGVGATRSETIKQVIIPAALPGIVAGFLLAASRAIGETMIVVMAAGLAANLTVNPLEAVTTVTVQIVTLLTGDQEFDSAKTLAAFALGLMLFITTMFLNMLALYVIRKYREQYE